MKTQAAVAALGSCALLVGCGDGVATWSPLEPTVAVANVSSCYAVAFSVEMTSADGVVFEGPISGDLEGTVEVLNTGFTWPPTGATNTSTFEFSWHVTGGIIPELIGESFSTAAENRNVLHFLLPPARPFAMNVGKHRAVAGVQKANLTYTGLTNVDGSPSVTRLDHHGVICP